MVTPSWTGQMFRLLSCGLISDALAIIFRPIMSINHTLLASFDVAFPVMIRSISLILKE